MVDNEVVMLKEILLAASCVAVFGGASGMEPNMVDNPIPLIIDRFSAITPEHTIETFKTSVENLLSKLRSEEIATIFLSNSILSEKWKQGASALVRVKDFNWLSGKGVEYAEREKVYKEISDITDNGFYTFSNTLLIVTPSLQPLKSIFDTFWQLLLQAREIAVWRRCCAPKIPVEEVPSAYSEACRMISYSANPAMISLGNVLQSICILREEKSVMAELVSDETSSKEEIIEQAKHRLEPLYGTIPSLRAVSAK
jgi:hypothetical protein